MKNKSDKTVPIPVYSNIRLVNGRIIAVVDDVIDTPIDWLEGDSDGERTCKAKKKW